MSAPRAPGGRSALLAAALLVLAPPGLLADVEVEESPGVSIPDANTTGISRTLTVPAVTITSMELEVEIPHGARGDLRVELRSPAGTTVRVHDRKGGSSNDLSTTFPRLTVPAESLEALVGQEAAGTWTLTVSDAFTGSTGTLARWKLIFHEPPAGPTVPFAGSITYRDREVSASGYGTPTDLPVRFADVEVFRVSDGAVLARGDTDGAGNYSLQVPDEGTVDLGLRVLTRQATVARRIEVVNNESTRATYSLVTTASYDTSAPIAQDLVAADLVAAGVFNIFDQSVEGIDEISARLGSPPGRLRVYWEPGTTDGTYFTTLDDSVHLLGITADPDEFDDDVILHEIGHFQHFTLSRSDSPGGSHSPQQQSQDPRLAFAEGYANYFSSSVRNDPEYFDFNQAGTTVFELDGPSFPSAASGHDSENTVQAVLWDVFDGLATPGNAVDDDPMDLPDAADRIWKVLENQFGSPALTTLESFVEGWAAEHGGDFRTFELRSIHEGFGVDFDRDRLFLATPARAIPDNSEVVEFLTVTQNVTLDEVNVFVDIDHPDPSDLVITLVSPGNTSVVLFNRGNSPAVLPSRPGDPGVFDWFQANELTPFASLGAYAGASSIGTWQLRVQDASTGSTGTLNRWSLDLRGLPPGFPNLVPTSVSGPGAAVAGGSVAVPVTVRNSGTAAASAFQVRVVLSEDRTITAADATVGTLTVPGLSPGTDFTGTVNGTTPALPSGTYFMGLLADDASVIFEGDETDNALPAASGTALSGASAGVDLSLVNLTAPTSGVSPGALAVSVDIVNQGGDPATPFSLAYLLSADASITLSDTLLEQVNFTGLAGATSVSDSRSVTLPPDLLPGDFFVGALVDFGFAVAETEEGNNTAVAGNSTQISLSTSGVDLVAESLTGPAAAAVGTPFTVDLEVRNAGEDAAPGFDVSVFLSTNVSPGGDPVDFAGFVTGLIAASSDQTEPTSVNALNFSFTDDPNAFNAVLGLPGGEGVLLGTVSLPGLAAGESRVDQLSVTVPAGQPSGSFLLIASIDPQNLILETQEGNNVVDSGAATAVGAALLPDLTASNVVVPPSIALGGDFSVTRTLTNLGGVGTGGGFTEEYFLVYGSEIDGTSVSLGSFSLTQVAAGEGEVRTRVLSVPLTASLTGAARIGVRVDSGNTIFELDETNNEALSGGTLAVQAASALPDLVPTRIEFRGVDPGQEVFAGQALTVNTRVTNLGLTSAGLGTTSRVILSVDTVAGVPPDLVLAEFATASLVPQASQDLSVALTLPVTLTDGTYFLGLEVDVLGQLAELNEANNALVTTAPTEVSSAVAGIDLLFSVIEEPFVATPGTSMSFDLLAVNRGTDDFSTPFFSRFYLSSDGTFDGGDLELTPAIQSAGFAGLGQQALRPRIDLPASIGPGPFFLIGIIDADGAVAEVDETNNIAVTATSFTTLPATAELRMQNLALNSASVAQGGRLLANTVFDNVGTASTGSVFSLQYEITSDALDPLAPRIPLDSYVDGPLTPGEGRFRLEDPVNIPLSLTPGTYDVCVELDPTGAIAEAGTAGNSFCQLGLVVSAVSEPPDYIPTNVYAPFAAFQNQRLRIDRRVDNQGQTAATTSSTIGYFLSVDDVIEPSDILIGTEVIGPLGSGANLQGSFTATIPATTPSGTYFAGLIVDLFDEIGDGAPANNSAAAEVPTTILGSPDLTILSLSSPITVLSGQDLQVDRTIGNIGTGPEIGSYLTRYFLSLDTTFDSRDFLLGVSGDLFLAAGANEFQSLFFPVPVPLAPGTYFLGAEVDATNLSDESNEGNNFTTYPVPITVIGAPDLKAVSVVSQTTGTTGTPITLTGRIKNVGNLPTPSSFNVDFYLTASGTPTSTDPSIGAVTIDRILVPQQEIEVVSVLAVPNTTPGTYTVYMELDGANVIVEADESLLSNSVLEATTTAILGKDAISPLPQVRYLDSATGVEYPDSDYIPAGLMFIQIDFGEPVLGPPLVSIEVFDGPDLAPTSMTKVTPDGQIWRLPVPVLPHDGVTNVDGGRTVSLTGAADLSGNPALPVSTAEAFFSVDTRPPVFTTLVSPAENGTHPPGSITVTGQTTDASPVEILANVNAGAFVSRVTTEPVSGFSFVLAPIATQTTSFQVLARDRAGNQAAAPVRTVHEDADGDTLPDFWEIQFTGGLTVLSAAGDFDSDGLSDAGEFAAGTSPVNPDTDGDGVTDGAEVAAGTDPVNSGNLVPNASAVPGAAGPPRRVTLDGSGSFDPDGEPLAYQWTQLSGPSVGLVGDTAAVATGLFLRAGTYVHQLVVTDGKISSTPVLVTNTVSNLPPEARIRFQQVVATGSSTRLEGGSSRDPNADQVNHNWTEDAANPALGTLSAPNFPAVTATIPGAFPGTYMYTDQTDDGVDPTLLPASVEVVAVAPLQTPPAADAGPDLRTLPGVPVTLLGSGSRDPEQSLASMNFVWSPAPGNPAGATLTAPGPLGPDRPVFSSTTPGAYKYFLQVVAGGHVSPFDTVTVVVEGGPTALAGGPYTFLQGTTAQLDGSRTAAFHSGALSFQWRQVRGVPVQLVGASGPTPSFVATHTGDYEFELVVRDAANSPSKPAIAKVRVLDPANGVPVARATFQNLGVPSINGRIEAGELVRLDATASVDDGPVSFSWKQLRGPWVLLSGASGPTPTLTPPFGTYLFEVTVSDGIHEDTARVAFAVDGANEPPVVPPVADQIVAPGVPVQLSVAGTVDPEGLPLEFVWVQLEGAPVVLTGQGTSQVSFVPPGLDTYLFEIRVFDTIDWAPEKRVRVVVQPGGAASSGGGSGGGLPPGPTLGPITPGISAEGGGGGGCELGGRGYGGAGWLWLLAWMGLLVERLGRPRRGC